MGLPDHLALYRPVFHFHSLWLLVTGIIIGRGGIVANAAPAIPGPTAHKPPKPGELRLERN